MPSVAEDSSVSVSQQCLVEASSQGITDAFSKLRGHLCESGPIQALGWLLSRLWLLDLQRLRRPARGKGVREPLPPMAISKLGAECDDLRPEFRQDQDHEASEQQSCCHCSG